MDKHMDEARKMNALRAGLFNDETKNNSRWAHIRTGLMVAIAVMLVMSAAMGAAWANSWDKTINLTSEPDSRPSYIRVRAFCAEYELEYKNTDNWTQDGDWWYYNKTLDPGKSLADSGDELTVHIADVPDTGTPGLEDDETFSVIIVYESTDVQYDKDGNEKTALNADWSRKVDTSRITSTQGGDN